MEVDTNRMINKTWRNATGCIYRVTEILDMSVYNFTIDSSYQSRVRVTLSFSLDAMAILGLKPCSEPTKPAHFDIEKVIRPNILSLHPYRCARDDYQEGILLDANENALGHSINSTSSQIPPELRCTLGANLNRYPDPSFDEIKLRIATLRGLPCVKHVFLGVGSDEVIDLIMRVCLTPAHDKILITPPTYGMYAVCAQVNDVSIVRCNLNLSGSEGEGGEKGRFSVLVDSVGPFLIE